MKMTEFKDIKKDIVEAQLYPAQKDKVVDLIMEGAGELLSANDVIKKLGITVGEFEELIDLPNHYLRKSNDFLSALNGESHLFNRNVELINKDLERKATFPKPDLYILGKARWTKDTVRAWLKEQCR